MFPSRRAYFYLKQSGSEVINDDGGVAMFSTSRKRKRKFLGTIDPTSMKKRQRLALGYYLAEHQDAPLIRKNARCTTFVPKASTQYTFELANKLLHEKSETGFDVQSNEKLGKGAFGSVRLILGRLTRKRNGKAVFKADEDGSLRVSKKIKQREGEDKEDFFADINRECELAKKTPHIEMEPLIHFPDPRYQSRETCYLRMPYFKGETLKRIIKSGGIPSIDSLIELSLNMALALQMTFHDRGLVHRDFKPGNIIVSKAYEVAIIDIGLAKELGEPVCEYAGTIFYMAPEQIDYQETNEATDIYALGKIYAEIWRLITGTLQDMKHRDSDKVRYIIRSGDTEFDTTEFDKLKGIRKKHKVMILEMVKQMTLYSRDDRCNLDKVIATWDTVKLERELALTSKRNRLAVNKNYTKVIEERRSYRESLKEKGRLKM